MSWLLCCCYPSTTNTKSKLKTDDLGSFAMNSMEEDTQYTGSYVSSSSYKPPNVTTTADGGRTNNHNNNNKTSISTTSSPTTPSAVATTALSEELAKDYEDLEHIARKREIRITIRKGTQAGVAAGLSVMAGVIIAGPVGAVVGGTIGTAVAHKMAKNVVSLNELLKTTPAHKRHDLLKAFNESFQEEFNDTIRNNPELRLLMSGTSIFGVMRYMVDREMLRDDQLVRLDGILRKVI